jgi:hypothetical protein
MRALKPLLLLLAIFALAGCGGGGGGSSSVFNPPGPDSISVSAAPASITTNSFTAITVVVNKNDGTPENDGTTVNASLSPSTIGTVTSTASAPGGGSSATNTLSGGKTTFYFNSTNQAGTASIAFSLPAGVNGSPNSVSKSLSVTVTAGNNQDPRLQLTATTTTLPLDPFSGGDQVSPFTGNYIGSPYIAEVTVTWRHSNGQLIAGTLQVTASIDFVTIASFSTLDDPATTWSGQTKTPPDATGNEFLTEIGSGPVNVTGGNGAIFVHAGDIPGTATLTVTAIDPDSGQTISSQLVFTVAGAASSLPASITALANGNVYVSGSSGPQSTVIQASVFDGSDAAAADPNGFDNVEFQIIGPAGSDARLSGLSATGAAVTGTKIDTVTHSGIATVSFQAGTVQGPVQVKVTADRADNNVDNGIQDPVTATATVTVSDGKLFSITIDSPDTDSTNPTGVSTAAVEDPAGSGNYVLTLSAKGIDRQGNAVLPGTQFGWGDVDSPQQATTSTNLRTWFSISGTSGDPQEGGTLFTATDGHFTTAGGGAGPGDTLLVIGKASEGAPAGNDDLESAVKITSVNSATSLTVSTPFNLNDRTGVSVTTGLLPYIVGRATFSSVQTPSFTDSLSSTNAGVGVTTLNYPASAIGKAVAVWAQGTGTDTNTSPGRTDIVTDIALIRFPGSAAGAIMTASPDPLIGNSQQFETVCYYDGANHPIANYDISFAFNFNGVGSGSADGVSNSGKFQQLTGANGCVTVSIVTASIPPTGTTTTTPPSVTFSAGPTNATSTNGASQTSVTVPFVVNAAQLQTSCPAATNNVFTVNLKLLDGSGNGIAGQAIAATCTTTSGTGTLTAGTILPTDGTGSTTAAITVAPAGTTGKCIFTASSFPSIVASINVAANGAGSCSGGFSPQP